MAFRPRILVVEDDPKLQRVLMTTMQHMGGDPQCVSGGAEAISRVEGEKFDGVFVDWDNPDSDPLELTRRIRRSASNSKIPVAMLSSRKDQRDVSRSFQAGTTFFLAKPFGTNEIERLLNATRGAMLEDRRCYDRVALNIPTLCEWGKKRGTRRVAGESLNLSLNGILLKVTPPPEKGVSITLDLALPKALGHLLVKGIVTRQGPGEQTAVRFANLTREQEERLEKLITNQPSSRLFAHD